MTRLIHQLLLHQIVSKYLILQVLNLNIVTRIDPSIRLFKIRLVLELAFGHISLHILLMHHITLVISIKVHEFITI